MNNYSIFIIDSIVTLFLLLLLRRYIQKTLYGNNYYFVRNWRVETMTKKCQSRIDCLIFIDAIIDNSSKRYKFKKID